MHLRDKHCISLPPRQIFSRGESCAPGRSSLAQRRCACGSGSSLRAGVARRGYPSAADAEVNDGDVEFVGRHGIALVDSPWKMCDEGGRSFSVELALLSNPRCSRAHILPRRGSPLSLDFKIQQLHSHGSSDSRSTGSENFQIMGRCIPVSCASCAANGAATTRRHFKQ